MNTTEMMAPLYFHLPIMRVNEEDRTVEGCAFANEVVEGEGGIRLSRQAMEEASPDYMTWGALREMHQPIAAGSTQSLTWNDGKAFIKAYVSDDQAWKKVKDRTYKGFSVGVVPTLRRGNTVVGCRWLEVSLVDRPKDPDATITTYRMEKPDQLYEVQVMDDLKFTAPAVPYTILRADTNEVVPVIMERGDGMVMVHDGEPTPEGQPVAYIPTDKYERGNKPDPALLAQQIRPPDPANASKQAPPEVAAPTTPTGTSDPTPENLAKQNQPPEAQDQIGEATPAVSGRTGPRAVVRWSHGDANCLHMSKAAAESCKNAMTAAMDDGDEDNRAAEAGLFRGDPVQIVGRALENVALESYRALGLTPVEIPEPITETRSASQPLILRTEHGNIDVSELLTRVATAEGEALTVRAELGTAKEEIKRLESMPTRTPAIRHPAAITRENVAAYAEATGPNGDTAASDAIKAKQAQYTELEKSLRVEPEAHKRQTGVIALMALGDEIRNLQTYGV